MNSNLSYAKDKVLQERNPFHCESRFRRLRTSHKYFHFLQGHFCRNLTHKQSSRESSIPLPGTNSFLCPSKPQHPIECPTSRGCLAVFGEWARASYNLHLNFQPQSSMRLKLWRWQRPHLKYTGTMCLTCFLGPWVPQTFTRLFLPYLGTVWKWHLQTAEES